LNVLFVNPPPLPYKIYTDKKSDGTGAYYIQKSMPLSILYLSSYVKEFAPVDRVETLDFVTQLELLSELSDLEKYVNLLADQVDFVPDVLAWSILFSTANDFYVDVAPMLKKRWPNAVVVAGGAHPTNCTRLILEEGLADYVACGEGEVSFAHFLTQLKNGENIDVKGIYNLEKLEQAGPQKLAIGEYHDDLDLYPLPDWEVVDMDAYMKSSISRKRDFGSSTDSLCASIMTSRGCPFHCTFCGSHTVHGRKMRYNSNERVLEEIQILHERYGATLFIPEDDLFTVHKPRIIKLLDAVRRLEIPDMEVQFPNALSVNTLDEDIIDALESVGMRIAVLAIESGSEYVQTNIIKKRCDLDRAMRLVSYIRSKGLYCRCYYIFGFPGESKAMMQETVDFAARLGADWANFNIAVPLVGTEMYEQYKELGVFKHDSEVFSSIYIKRQFDTPEISADDLNDFQYRANIDVNFLKHPLICEERYAEAITIFQDILRSYPFHIFARYMISKCALLAGDEASSDKELAGIDRLIKTDVRARDLFDRYGDMLPEDALSGLHENALSGASTKNQGGANYSSVDRRVVAV